MKKSIEKVELHVRNKHRSQYDFQVLNETLPELKNFVSINKFGNESIDFANPAAVKALNKALLMQFYGIKYWDIPPQNLCPPIPGRADYIHYAADILAANGKIPTGKQIRVLDVGVGANTIYPIIGNKEYGWRFVGSDIDKNALQNAQKIIDKNDDLIKEIEFRWQSSPKNIFKNIIQPNEYFDLTLCNPPFHASQADAMQGTQRKLNNLGKNEKPILNFGGQASELWCEGGEVSFVLNLISESVVFRKQCLWFSTLVSKSENLKIIQSAIEKVNAAEVKIISMATGNKISRVVFWTFMNETQKQAWMKRWKY